MPPINHVALSAGVAAVTVAVAAAIAIYENEDLQRYANELRRRLAMALHSLGNELDPAQTNDLEPLFNRPEDAEGFLVSSRDAGGNQNSSGEVEADEASRRRQRDELMYWNALRESKLEAERTAQNNAPPTRARGASFDDFLKPDAAGESGTFVVSSGAEVAERSGLMRRNVGSSMHSDARAPGLTSSVYANPFSDDQRIEEESMSRSMLAPADDEMSDIYSATSVGGDQEDATTPLAFPSAAEGSSLIEFASNASSSSTLSGTMDRGQEEQASEDEDMTPGIVPAQMDYRSSFAEISAWADRTESSEADERSWSPAASSSQGTHARGFATPDDSVSLSEPELLNAEDAQSVDEHGVLSDSDDGMHTPGSWSEVGSEVSESELSMRGRAADLA